MNLIEARPGILTLLDEECLRPGVTNDETLLDKFNTYLNKEQFYESREKNKKEKWVLKLVLPLENRKSARLTKFSV